MKFGVENYCDIVNFLKNSVLSVKIMYLLCLQVICALMIKNTAIPSMVISCFGISGADVVSLMVF